MSLSGYLRAEKNVSHRVEDSLKNMKSCSDFLKYLTCSFKSSNIETMKKLKIPCINIIGNTMTVSLCYIGSRQKWAFVEARSTIIPTRLTDKNIFIKAFELLAFLEVGTRKQCIRNMWIIDILPSLFVRILSIEIMKL
jgi:hypothetical protein